MIRMPTFIISLPSSHHAYQAVAQQLDSTIFHLYEPISFPGRSLPDSVCLKLTNDPASVNNKGALGCMLAHLSVWEAVVKLGLRYALILEDDVIGSNLERVRRLELPSSFDVIFCNDRSANISADGTESERLRFADIAYSLLGIEENGLSNGTDAYFISMAGAKKLIAAHAQDSYFGHVDRRLLAYSIETEILERYVDVGPMIAELVQIHKIVEKRPILSAFFCTPPLFTHIGIKSRRVEEDLRGRDERISLESRNNNMISNGGV